MKNSQKGFVGTLIGLFLTFALAGSAYYFSGKNSLITINNMQKNIIQDWKTYTDSTYNFSIQYPPELVMNTKAIDGGKEFTFESQVSRDRLAIDVIAAEASMPLDACAAGSDYSTVVINGISFRKSDVSKQYSSPGVSASVTRYCAMKNSTTYTLDIINQVSNVQGNSAIAGESMPDFEKIISTFVLTK